jgi:hypothetical protein
MNKLIIWSFALILFTSALIAQPSGSPVINIFKPYEPKVIDAKKIMEVPSISDSIKADMVIKYDLYSRLVGTTYELDPIKAAKMKSEPLSKLQRGFLKAGFGNYSTPYLEAFYNSTRHKKYNGGVHLKHLSSTGQLNNTGFSGFSENTLGLNGKSFINKHTLSGALDFKRDVVHFYGFNPKAPEFLNMPLGREDIRQRYNLFDLKLGFNDHYPLDSVTNKYRGGLQYYNYSDAGNHTENFIGINGRADFYIKQMKLDAGLIFENYSNEINGNSINNTIIGIKPGIGLGESKWKLRLGFAAITGIDSTTRGFIAPEVDFKLHLYDDILVFFAGTESKLQRNSFRTLSTENPFVRPDLEMRNTVMPFRLYSGLRGVASSRTSYKASIAYSEMENVPFYVNETMLVDFPDGQGNLIPTVFNANRMEVIYDNSSLLHFNAEIAHQRTDKLNLSFGVDYLKFTPDVELEAWHTPTLRWKMTGRYNLEDKITIKANVFNLNRQFAREFRRDSTGASIITARQLRGITDLNLGAEYQYTKRMYLFLNVNNVLGVRYQRYLGYPTQRFNVLGGLSFSF